MITYGLILLVLIIAVSLISWTANTRDTAQETTNQLAKMGVANACLVIAFGYMASLYIQENPSYAANYMFMLVHTCLFMTLMALSVGTIKQVA